MKIVISYSSRCILLFAFIIAASCVDSSTNSTTTDAAKTSNFDSRQPPGASVDAFLSNDQFSVLQIEVDYMAGHQPQPQALDSLQSFLEQQTDKSKVIIDTPTQIPSGGNGVYTTGNLKGLEDQHRNQFTQTNSDTLRTYSIIVDGSYFESPIIASTAYYNTSIVLFGETAAEANADVRSPPKQIIEATVLQHSFGHLLGLVGNGTPQQSEHRVDGTHCTVEGCLMRTFVASQNYFQFAQSIPALDSLCTEDLAAISE